VGKRETKMGSKRFRSLAIGMGLNISFLIAYPILFFLVLPNAGLQFLPIVIKNTGATWNQFFYDFYIWGELFMFIGFILVPLVRK
jgi:hypothetical protein